ncbi:hypothetical protein NM688_g210 [Phlebia brevispora]|uniref:Uncharacterized protein n=1 Tax=Phlebia brevispora TaxID=194682 RepID=A0ACC1TEQ9_9APHY|nr:hypothetical protein NM688_g210 [Phlebia brevispora]
MPRAKTEKRQPILKEDKKYQCDCTLRCKYLKEIAKATFYIHRRLEGNTWSASSTAYVEDSSVPGGKRFIEPYRERREPNDKPFASAPYPHRSTQAQKAAAYTHPNADGKLLHTL